MSWRGRKKKKVFKVDGVKIQNAKKQTYDGVDFKSGLEAFCYRKLKENNINDFEYEKHTFVLQDKFVSTTSGFEVHNRTVGEGKSRKLKAVFGEVTNNIRAITYTPDFVHLDQKSKTGWIIETKGWQLNEFKIKWKMFKMWLKNNGYTVALYTPNTQENVIKSIESIKSKYYI